MAVSSSSVILTPLALIIVAAVAGGIAANQRAATQPKQKPFKTYHPDKAQKPRLPDPIIQPIAVMPPSRTKTPLSPCPLIEDLSRNGIEDCSYSPEAQKSNTYSTPYILTENLFS
ncbi:hypothetical protein TNCV_824351 [Trichonephila clavipes]|nr:hypothetical protein TNCV_824351 [Trichonephila clavipes]